MVHDAILVCFCVSLKSHTNRNVERLPARVVFVLLSHANYHQVRADNAHDNNRQVHLALAAYIGNVVNSNVTSPLAPKSGCRGDLNAPLSLSHYPPEKGEQANGGPFFFISGGSLLTG